MYLNWKKMSKRENERDKKKRDTHTHTSREEKFLSWRYVCVCVRGVRSLKLKEVACILNKIHGMVRQTVHNIQRNRSKSTRNQRTTVIICIEPNDRHFKVFFALCLSLGVCVSVRILPFIFEPYHSMAWHGMNIVREHFVANEARTYNTQPTSQPVRRAKKERFQSVLHDPKNLIYDITLGRGIFHLS